MNNKKWLISSLVIVIPLTCYSYNYFSIARPVRLKLQSDSRNVCFEINCHYKNYVDFYSLTIDLTSQSGAAPMDLLRGLMQTAEVFANNGKHFDQIILARSGTPVFMMKGSDFYELGSQYGSQQNPLYLIRTLPEKLQRPDGAAAFSEWKGGLLGVLSHQMQDVNEAATQWGTVR
jgi:hypothetical protein